MKIRIVAFLFVSLLVLPSAGHANNEIIDKAHLTTHTIAMDTVLDGNKCSATAVGPHALLTASHCELPTDRIFVDTNKAMIGGVIRDGKDHTIYLVDMTFKNYAPLGPSEFSQGDQIFIFGNPGDGVDLFRNGYVSGFRVYGDSQEPGKGKEVLFDMNGFHGDSGAGIFNTDGEIISVVSFGHIQQEGEKAKKDHEWSFVMMGGFPLTFTPAQIATAKAFVPPPPDPAAPDPKHRRIILGEFKYK
jgi:hypothetical protein